MENDRQFAAVAPEVDFSFDEAPLVSTSVFVADVDPDTLQSGCGPKDGSPVGKLRARDETFCQNKHQPPVQWKPTNFDFGLLSPEPEQAGVLVFTTPSEEKKKCIAPYQYNLCCNGVPNGFSLVNNFFKVWTTIVDCYLTVSCYTSCALFAASLRTK